VLHEKVRDTNGSWSVWVAVVDATDILGFRLLLLLVLVLVILLEGEDHAGVDTLGSLPTRLGGGSVVEVRQVARARPAQLPVFGQIVVGGMVVNG
jgi:hypothetical protein